MIRLLSKLVKWLEVRFPEKVVVTAYDYRSLVADLAQVRAEMDLLRDETRTNQASHLATIDRVSHLEASAVHKGAVLELVNLVKAQKDEMISLKASLGWNRNAHADAEIAAVLNGEPISNE